MQTVTKKEAPTTHMFTVVGIVQVYLNFAVFSWDNDDDDDDDVLVFRFHKFAHTYFVDLSNRVNIAVDQERKCKLVVAKKLDQDLILYKFLSEISRV